MEGEGEEVSARIRLAALHYCNLLSAEALTGKPADPALKAKLLKAMEPDYPCTPSQLPSARCKESDR